MTSDKQRSDAVRQYLLALQDPAALHDEAAISELERALSEEEDPLERVKLQGRLSAAQSVTADDFEPGFVEHAREWADKNGVPADAFLAEGVSEEVLERAGVLARTTRQPSARRRRSGGRSRVSAEEVVEVIKSRDGTFTTSEIGELTGASTATVRKYIQQLLEEGVLVDKGADPDHQSRGRAPNLYAVSG